MKKIIICTILTVLLSLSPLFANGQKKESNSPAQGKISSNVKEYFEPITIIDSNNREIIFDKPVETIITLMPSTNEVIKILDSWDKVIGRGQWTTNITYFPNLDKVSIITGGTNSALDYEKILELSPDLFLISKNPGVDDKSIIEKLSPYMNVMIIDLSNINSLNENVKTLGKILGKEDIANNFIQFNNSVLNLISDRTKNLKDVEKPKVFFKSEGWTADQLCTMTNKTSQAITQIIMTGGINLAADLPGEWIESVDPEWLMSQNPDVIIAPFWEGFFPGVWGFDVNSTSIAIGVRDNILTMDVLKSSNAVKNKQVYLYDSKIVSSPAVAMSMLYVAKWLHPDLFKDINPQEYHQKYISDFMRVDVDLSKTGLFFFPVE